MATTTVPQGPGSNSGNFLQHNPYDEW